MNEEAQFKIYEKLMMKALKHPNEINNLCITVIISLAKMASKTNEEFKEITDFMNESYESLDDIEDMMLKALLMKKVMDL